METLLWVKTFVFDVNSLVIGPENVLIRVMFQGQRIRKSNSEARHKPIILSLVVKETVLEQDLRADKNPISLVINAI